VAAVRDTATATCGRAPLGFSYATTTDWSSLATAVAPGRSPYTTAAGGSNCARGSMRWA
jgi:hypothetical protein